jgi:hypothetical protein
VIMYIAEKLKQRRTCKTGIWSVELVDNKDLVNRLRKFPLAFHGISGAW